jgi:hypothetical protein
MGFYLRKALGFGPVRVNVSKSGLGFSIGVKGARIGVTPAGQAYLQAGRGGIYFRQSLTHPPERGDVAPSPAPAAGDRPVQIIESADAAQLSDSTQAELVKELQRVRRRVPRVVVVVCATLALAAVAIALGTSQTVTLPTAGWIALALALASVVGVRRAYQRDKRDGTVRLTFDVAPEIDERGTALRSALKELVSCQRLWCVESRQSTSDWKRNAGVSTLVKRRAVTASDELPRGVVCDTAVTSLPAGRQTLYFFPFGLVAYDSTGIGVIPYDRLKVESGIVAFTEDSDPPSDARVIGQTWRFVNKSGGPDRRFNNNRQLPIAEYGVLSLTSETGLNELFHTSRPPAAKNLEIAVGGMPATTSQIRRIQATPKSP